MQRPPRPNGIGPRGEFWRWAYDSLVELRASHGPGVFTDSTTRGVFRRMMNAQTFQRPDETPFIPYAGWIWKRDLGFKLFHGESIVLGAPNEPIGTGGREERLTFYSDGFNIAEAYEKSGFKGRSISGVHGDSGWSIHAVAGNSFYAPNPNFLYPFADTLSACVLFINYDEDSAEYRALVPSGVLIPPFVRDLWDEFVDGGIFPS